MKKYTTFVENEKGEQKKISVWLDDETARAIDEANDPEITQFYILDKHKEDLIQRKETRRHTSLEYLFEQGHFIEDQNSDLSQYGVRMENISKVRKALSALTDKQYAIVMSHCIEGLSFREIARRMYVSKNTVMYHFEKAEKNNQKFFINSIVQNAFLVPYK